MPVELTTDGTEESTYVVTASFTDEDDNSVIPNNINWWLYDSSRNIVNGRSNVPIIIPAASVNILLQGDDLAIIGTDNRRVMRIEYDYDSLLGFGLPGKAEIEFDITNLETYVGALETLLTLTVNTNTWATLAEANSYMESIWSGEVWIALAIENRKKLLIHAYRWINRLSNYSISSVTNKLKYAQIELAWYIYENSDTHKKHEALEAQGVTEFRLSKFYEKLSKVGLPQVVKDLLDDYDVGSGGYVPLLEREVDDNE